MGNKMSEEERKEREQKELDKFVSELKEGPDLSINDNIIKFCDLSSSDNLKNHYEKKKMEADDCAPDWIKSLMEKLSGLKRAPALAGLGSLAVAIFIDVISFTASQDSIKEALRSVFAEEKASEVWDLIDECLKRCTMHINDNNELKSDIKRIECQLSEALTKLKNSMVRDGHMSAQALKAWVNGAAFHIQMLIHLVRLGGIQTCDPVKSLLFSYEKDLDQLFEKHKETIQSKCRERTINPEPGLSVRYLEDEDSEWHSIYYIASYDKCFEVYYDHRFMWHKPQIQEYFRKVRKNLQSLVQQIGFFDV